MASNDKLHIDPIAAARQNTPLTFDLSNDYFESLEQDEITGGSIRVTVAAKAKTADYVTLTFDIAGEVRTPCDRCLDDVTYDVEVQDDIQLYCGEGEPADPDIRTMEPRATTYDIAWDIYELVETSLPLLRQHPEGTCNAEMLEMIARHAPKTEQNEEY